MILLDTCVLLCMAENMSLPTDLKRAMTKEPWGISAMSAWEIGIKYRIGKLQLPTEPKKWWCKALEEFNLQVYDFSDNMALAAGDLPPFHSDLFDRALIATALAMNLPVATIDPMFDRYAKECGLKLAGR